MIKACGFYRGLFCWHIYDGVSYNNVCIQTKQKAVLRAAFFHSCLSAGTTNNSNRETFINDEIVSINIPDSDKRLFLLCSSLNHRAGRLE